jgi:hypothetical protein
MARLGCGVVAWAVDGAAVTVGTGVTRGVTRGVGGAVLRAATEGAAVAGASVLAKVGAAVVGAAVVGAAVEGKAVGVGVASGFFVTCSVGATVCEQRRMHRQEDRSKIS